ncbi:integrase, catalytic region, zinc finger, CCHC-type containing protein [Tanacetum coccineum]
MMTKSKICYDHSSKQAIGFEKPFYLKKARESKPKLYDGNTILKMDTIVIPDYDEILMLRDESRSKMLLKEQDPMLVKHKVNTKPINYAILNNDYYKRFVPQSDLYSEHAYWKATSVPPLNPSHSSTTVIVEVPKELPKVSMVNTSLKELKRYLTGFDQVVKERTTATAITEGTWGFEHTKACFRDEIIPFIKDLKDIFNNFNQYLVDELADVQEVFYQMEQVVEQHRLESRTFEVKMNQVLSENERLLAQAIDKDIVKTVVNLSVNASGETVNECQKCLELKTELLNKKDFVDKETYDKLCKCFTTLEKHCITLEVDSQLNQEIFQQENSVLNQNAPSFTQLFELSELKAQSQAKDTVIVKLKEQIKSLNGNVEDSTVKMDMDEIETLNIELEHRVTKLVTENEHLKQTYKQLYDSIKPKRVQSKEQCDALIQQVNIKSREISDLNAKLQEQGLVIAALKNELRKLKGKALDNEDTVTHSVDPKVSKDNMEPITPKLLNKRTAHSSYIKHTQEEALVLRDIVEHVKANYPQDPLLESAFRYTKVIQDLLSHISRSCPSINNCGPQLIEVTPRKKDKRVRFAESLTSTENTKPDSTSNIVSNKRVLHSTGVRLSTSASGSQPSGNTRNDRILQTPSSNSKNKVEAHPRNVKSSLNKRNRTVQVIGSASVQNSKQQVNSDSVYVNSDDCMSSDNLCVSNSMNDVKFRAKSKKRKSKKNIWKPTGKVFTQIGYIWRPTGRTFTIIGNTCPLTRITTPNEVPSTKPIVLESESPKPMVTLVYSRKPRKNKNTESVSKTKVVQIVLWYLDFGCSKHMTRDRSQLTNFISKFLGTVKFGNDQVAKIMGYGYYQIGNVTISRVYYVEGLGHNLFSVGQFCDSNLEVAFRQHTCFIRNLEGVDLLTGSRGDNLYTLSLGNMMASSPICLLSKASKTKSWLWHRRLSHLNFGAINHLARHGLVRGLPKLKFEKDHLCSACALGKSSKKPHKPKSEDTNQEKLYLLHMDLCGPMRVASVNGKKYILVIVDDYSRFTWVVQIVLWYLDSGCSKHMTGDRSQLTNFISKFLGTVKFGNDQVAKIMGYGDYQIGNVTISRVYYVEGLGHNLFSVGQFCDSNLEVAFRQHTCFIRNLEGVDLLTGSRGDNLYTLSLGNMMASSPICLLSKASKTKSWLWHRRLSHLNFGSINHLARHGLVRGLPKLKFEKDHLCSACALGKSSKKPHKPKSEDTNQEKLYLLHMDLCGPMRVASVNGKKYILVIVDDYSRFTWVKCLRSKDEAPAFIINFLKMIQVRLKETVRRIRTDNGTEFINQTLREYYEKVGISYETSVARSSQQNGVVERRNPIATACYTQNRSMIRRRHGKTPYELLHDKPPDLSYLHVFGALCYPTNDSENLGKLQPKADIGIFIGYAPTKKAFWIYNRRTRQIIETIYVNFDELTAMASEHSSSGPALHDITPITINSGLMPNPPPSTPFVPPSRSDWDLLFQPLFDESLNPPPYVDLQAPEVTAPIKDQGNEAVKDSQYRS